MKAPKSIWREVALCKWCLAERVLIGAGLAAVFWLIWDLTIGTTYLVLVTIVGFLIGEILAYGLQIQRGPHKSE